MDFFEFFFNNVTIKGEGWGFVANAGDCRAILFHKGKVVNLSTDHRILRTGVSSPETQRVIDLVCVIWIVLFLDIYLFVFRVDGLKMDYYVDN